MAQFNVTELDFDKIKDSLKSYLRAQDKYTDWDFDGSGLNVLLDILAYNTHYNAMLAHFSLNETFLDSAQIRGNVVSHAKLLGYVPRSATASTASLAVTITPTIDYTGTDYTIPRGTRLYTTYSGVQYNFVVMNSVTAYKTGAGNFEFRNNTDAENAAESRNSNPIVLKEGTLKRMLYRVNELVTNQKFEIPEDNLDTSTLRVRIKTNEFSDDYTTYTLFSSLSGVTDTTPIYFLQENSTGKYEIYFGDGIIGKKPINNNIVEVEYVYTNAQVANGASTFQFIDGLNYIDSIYITTTQAAYGGNPRETIESIRYNAPITYVSQNRAVTADDYKAIITRDFGAIDSIAVWGGENEVVPDFGKVYICIKPSGKQYLSTSEKDQIVNEILAGKNVVSIKPTIVDPEYTYIDLDVAFKYNPNLTDKPKQELESLVSAAIFNYSTQNLDRFDGVFRHSQLLKAIDSSNPAILNSSIRVFMKKYLTPVQYVTYYELLYSSPIYQTTSTESIITSDTFKIGGVTHILKDEPKTVRDETGVLRTTTDRIIYLYKIVGSTTTKIRSVGTIYASAGKVVIDNISPDSLTPIAITVLPNSNDLAPKRNQLLKIEEGSVSIAGEIDAIAVGGSTGTINYTTQSRHRIN